MSTFQILGLSLVGVFVALLLAGRVRRRLRRPSALAWLALWLAAGATIARPEITVWLARALGIARGADLVFYLAILGGLVAFFAVYLRLRRLDRAVTRIVRHLALDEGAEAPAGRRRRPPGE